MKKYANLIIGSSFSAIGYSSEFGNTLIVEQTEMLDTAFYLPLYGFCGKKYSAITERGRALASVFEERGIIDGSRQNVNAFEIGLCRFVELNPIDIYLKCRVAEVRYVDGAYKVTLLHNGGLEEIEAEKIIYTEPEEKGEPVLAVAFNCGEEKPDIEKIREAFGDTALEAAFYDGRYVIYPKVTARDVNDAKLEIYNRFKLLCDYRIL